MAIVGKHVMLRLQVLCERFVCIWLKVHDIRTLEMGMTEKDMNSRFPKNKKYIHLVLTLIPDCDIFGGPE